MENGKWKMENLENGYKQTKVGVIPNDWEVVKLGEQGECFSGLTYSPDNVGAEGLLVLRSSNIKENRLAFDDNVFVDVKVSEKLRTKEGDILICVRNGSRRLIGKAALIDKNAEGLTFGAFMSIFRTENYKFIFQLFRSNLLKKQIQSNLERLQFAYTV